MWKLWLPVATTLCDERTAAQSDAAFKMLLHTMHMRTAQCIVGNFRGKKLSQISRFCGWLRKFSPQNLGVVSFGAVQLSNPRKFSRRKSSFHQSTELFSCKGFPLFIMKLLTRSSTTYSFVNHGVALLGLSCMTCMWQLVSISVPPALLIRSGIIQSISCSVFILYNIRVVLHLSENYHVVGNFRGNFYNFEVLLLFAKVFSANLGLWRHQQAIRESFLLENLILQQFAKVFYHESSRYMVWCLWRDMSWTSRFPVLGRSYKSWDCFPCLHDNSFCLGFLYHKWSKTAHVTNFRMLE